MAISSLTITRTYANGLPWNAAKVDEILDSIETWGSQVAAKAADKTGTETITAAWTFTTPKLAGAGTGFATLQYANSSNDRTVTFPDPGGADSIVYEAAAATLANKTLTSPTINSPSVTSGSYVDKGTTSGAISFDLSAANIQKVTLNGAGTFSFTNPGSFERFLIIVKQDGTGSRTVTWPTTVRWLNGTGATDSTTDKPTLTTTANKFDVISFYYDSDLSLYIGTVAGYTGAIT